jgi:hypothetical protein
VTQIINRSTPGKERTQLSKAIVIAIREFMRQTKPDQQTKDIVAFVILALEQISEGIDNSVAAWEKRGYWVKADKYRMTWNWTGVTADKLNSALTTENWTEIAPIMLDIISRFDTIKVSNQHRMGTPWKNAYQTYIKSN